MSNSNPPPLPRPQFFQKLDQCTILPSPPNGNVINPDWELPKSPYPRSLNKEQIKQVLYYTTSNSTPHSRQYHHVLSPGPYDIKDQSGIVVKVPEYLSLLIAFADTELKRDCPNTRNTILNDIYDSLRTNAWSDGFNGKTWLRLVFNELRDHLVERDHEQGRFKTDKSSALFLADCGDSLMHCDQCMSFYRACAIVMHIYKVIRGSCQPYSLTNPSWLDSFQSFATRELVIHFEATNMSKFYRSPEETEHLNSFKEYIKQHLSGKSMTISMAEVINPYAKKRSGAEAGGHTLHSNKKQATKATVKSSGTTSVGRSQTSSPFSISAKGREDTYLTPFRTKPPPLCSQTPETPQGLPKGEGDQTGDHTKAVAVTTEKKIVHQEPSSPVIVEPAQTGRLSPFFQRFRSLVDPPTHLPLCSDHQGLARQWLEPFLPTDVAATPWKGQDGITELHATPYSGNSFMVRHRQKQEHAPWNLFKYKCGRIGTNDSCCDLPCHSKCYSWGTGYIHYHTVPPQLHEYVSAMSKPECPALEGARQHILRDLYASLSENRWRGNPCGTKWLGIYLDAMVDHLVDHELYRRRIGPLVTYVWRPHGGFNRFSQGLEKAREAFKITINDEDDKDIMVPHNDRYARWLSESREEMQVLMVGSLGHM